MTKRKYRQEIPEGTSRIQSLYSVSYHDSKRCYYIKLQGTIPSQSLRSMSYHDSKQCYYTYIKP
jgi:hypothetical protein